MNVRNKHLEIILFAVLLLFTIFVASVSAQQTSGPPAGYVLVWSDEFDGTNLASYWRPGGGLSVTHATVANGKASLNVSATGNYYNSSFIRTPSVTFRYGYFETYAQISTVQGVCFAFWLLHPTNAYPEIDIVERPGNAPGYQDIALFSARGTDGQWYSSWQSGEQSFPATATGFHKYALLWTPTKLTVYIDDVVTWRAPSAVVSKCTEPLMLYLDLCAAGCSFQGIIVPSPSPSVSTHAEVDYVRVYQGVFTVTKSGSDIVLSWPFGTLQQADQAGGTYTAMLGITSPYTNARVAAAKFYRVKAQ